MLLAADVGNTNIVLGCMEDGKLVGITRMETDRAKTAHEYAIAIHQALTFGGVDPKALEGCILASVVPQLNATLSAAIRMVTDKRPLVVGPGIKTGLPLRVEDPTQLGSDIVVGAAAALTLLPPPLVIIDMGTATTMAVIDGEGRFRGGCIMPGVGLGLQALADGTSQLPHISPEAPKKLINGDTAEAMRAGSVIGAACMIDGMLARMERELGAPLAAIATGGLSGVVIPHCTRDIRIEKNLLLTGLWVLWEKNKKPRKAGKEE